ncbi:hypothetical protein C7B80_33085 [Cyanosarcina cf. burmensis CCALA 770]|nr:hypothetical protein C7B80_33085 [Cyanosarcina cf. burmensis CCALA 770]
MTVTFTYLNHCIEIDLPDPEDSNTIYITLSKAEGTFDPNVENAYMTDFQHSAEAEDPNSWLAEAVEAAIATLGFRGIKYYEPKPVALTELEVSDIPF